MANITMVFKWQSIWIERHKMKTFIRNIMLILLLSILFISFAQAEEMDSFIVLYEDGTIEERKVEEENQIYSFFSVKEVLDLESQMTAIASEKNVKAVSVNQPIYFEALPTDLNANDAWRFEKTHMNDLWNEVTSNDWIDGDVVVAVIDTGIKTDHPDLNVIPGIDITDDATPNDPSDFSGHGTHVSGTIGARRDLGSDNIVGIAPGVKILPIKVFSDEGFGNIGDLGLGLRHAIDADVDIINMSLSYSNYSSVIEALVEEAEAKGIFIVAAASNDSNLWLQGETFDQDSDLDSQESNRQKVSLYYPSAHPTVMAVGSVAFHTSSDTLGISDFSNVSGLRDSQWSEIDVVAPGSYIYSSHHTNDGMVSVKSGTSMASPHVAGFAALLLSKYPTLTPEELRILIRDTAEDPGIMVPEAYNKEEIIGQGLINISKAFNYSPILDLSLDGVADFEFIESTMTYDLSVETNQESLTLNLETITGSGLLLNDLVLNSNSSQLDLDMGLNTFVIKATFGPVEKLYTLNIQRGQPELLDLEFYDGQTKIDMPVDVDNMPQAFWFEEDVENLKIVPIAGSSQVIEIDGQVLTEKTYDLSSDYQVNIRVLDPVNSDNFVEKNFKIIQVRDDIKLKGLEVNGSLINTPTNNQDLGILPYGPMTFAFDTFEGGGTLSYALNDGDEVSINSLENIILNTDFDTSQKLSVKVSVTGQRYQWYHFTFQRDQGLDIDAFKLDFYDGDNNLIYEHTSLDDLIYPNETRSVIVTLTPNYQGAQKSLTINNGSEAFDDEISLEGNGQDLEIRVFNSDLGSTSRLDTLRLDRQLNTDLVINLLPKASGLGVDYYTPFIYDKDTLIYDTQVSESVDALNLDLISSDDRLSLEYKLNDGSYQVYETPLDLLKDSTEEDMVYVKASAQGLQGLEDYEKIYEIRLVYIKDTALSDLQVKIEGVNQISFNQNLLDYDISYTSENSEVTLEAFKNHPGSNIEISKNDGEYKENLETFDLINLSKLSIKVENPLGDFNIYTLNFIERPLISESPLKSISVSGQSLSPAFTKDHLAYRASVTNSVDQVTLVIEVEDYAKAYTINGQSQTTLSLPLQVGENLINIEVLSEDATPYSYELVIERAQAVVIPVSPPPVVSSPPPAVAPPVALPPLENTEDEIMTVDFQGDAIDQVVVSLNRIQDNSEQVEIKGEDAVLFEPEVQTFLESFEGHVEVEFDTLKFQLKREHFLEHNKGPMLIKVEPLSLASELPIYELNIFVDNQKVSRLKNPIPLEINLGSKNLNPEYTGVYYFDEEENRWRFVGGKVTDDLIRFQVRHFSKYKVMEAFKSFEDIQGHWSEKNVERLASRDIIRGKSDLSFEPDASLTVAEFVALVTRVLDVERTDKETLYRNVKPGAWYEQVIKDASASNLLMMTFGLDTNFDRPILRQEMASILASAYGYYTGESNQSSLEILESLAKDYQDISPFYRKAVALTYDKKWVLGNDQGFFNPKSTATRAEASAVIERLLKTLNLM